MLPLKMFKVRFVILILFISYVKAKTSHRHYDHDHDLDNFFKRLRTYYDDLNSTAEDYSSEEYSDETHSSPQARPSEIKTERQPKQTAVKTERPITTYEVTENVIDIPNNASPQPINTNFTIVRPLNIAVVNNTSRFNNTNNREITEAESNAAQNNIVKRNELSADKTNGVARTPDFSYGISKYINDIKESITSNINGVNKNVHSDVNNGFNVPNLLAKPVLFLNKLRQKTSDVANKVHRAVFKHFEDN